MALVVRHSECDILWSFVLRHWSLLKTAAAAYGKHDGLSNAPSPGDCLVPAPISESRSRNLCSLEGYDRERAFRSPGRSAARVSPTLRGAAESPGRKPSDSAADSRYPTESSLYSARSPVARPAPIPEQYARPQSRSWFRSCERR